MRKSALVTEILSLYAKGYFVYEIANKLNITEHEVCEALGKRY